MLKVSMHQPNFLPYAGYFEKITRSDLFIIVDHVTFSKGKDNWHHRNRIRVPYGEGWDFITLPVSEHWNWRPFGEVVISDVGQFRKMKHVKTIVQNYIKSPLFHEYFDEFQDIYMADERRLSEFNISIIEWFLEKFRINVPVLRSTELGADPALSKDEMILDLMERVDGTHFLSGDGARTYIQPEKYARAGIGLEFQNFSPEPYPQAFNGFVPYLSALDMLFNTGKLVTNGERVPAQNLLVPCAHGPVPRPAGHVAFPPTILYNNSINYPIRRQKRVIPEPSQL